MRPGSFVHHLGVDSVVEFDVGVDYYEDDEPLERVLEVTAEPPSMVSTPPLSVLDVASSILQRLGKIDTYRLQKLCYYAQAQHVAFYGTRLFHEPIEAWPNGPVVPELWRRHAGRYEIDRLSEGDPEAVRAQPAADDTLNYVLALYGPMDGRQLSEMTHREQPWRDVRRGLRPKERSRTQIPVEALRDYYRSFEALEPFDDPDGRGADEAGSSAPRQA